LCAAGAEAVVRGHTRSAAEAILHVRLHAGHQQSGSPRMNLIPHIGPVAALIAGILILLVPRLLNYIVAIYLIVIGAVGLFGK
jgi:hypothetical protein